jgi:hypothetical protein
MTNQAFNPYPFVKTNEGDKIFYEFETDREVRYRAYFSAHDYMFGTHDLGCQFFSFDLLVVGSLRPPRGTPSDPRIAQTVQVFFGDIFARVDNVVIAVYDSSDQLQFARQRKFNSWFDGADTAYIERVDYEISTEDYTLLSSLFVRVDLPTKEAVLDLYGLVLEGGNIPLD